MIVPIIIVQTPVRVSKGCLKNEGVGKGARMLIHLISGSQSHERCRDCFCCIPFDRTEHTSPQIA